jgi:hypothetical protein
MKTPMARSSTHTQTSQKGCDFAAAGSVPKPEHKTTIKKSDKETSHHAQEKKVNFPEKERKEEPPSLKSKCRVWGFKSMLEGGGIEGGRRRFRPFSPGAGAEQAGEAGLRVHVDSSLD